jgi:hypothetical protein
MHCEHIHAVKLWRKGPGHYNTIFTNTDPSAEGMHSLDVAHVQLFFSFSHSSTQYPCTLILYIGSCMWVIHQTTTQACGWSNQIHQMMTMNPSPLSSTSIPSFEQHISFQYLAMIMYCRLFHSQTHSIHLLGFMSTNMWIITHLRLPSSNLPCTL